MRPSTSRMGWRSCRFQSRSVSRCPLNAATEKSGPLRKSNTRFRVAGVGARRCFADHARRGPGLHVERRHAPRIQFDEAVLHLDRAPLVLRRVPAGRHQARRAGDRPRVPGSVGQIGGEHFAFVRRDENVVGRRLLREHGHLALDQRHAAVGAAGAAGILEYRAPERFWRRSASPRAAAHRRKACRPHANRPPAASASTASTPDTGPARPRASSGSGRHGSHWRGNPARAAGRRSIRRSTARFC